jgi:hypothetical protein
VITADYDDDDRPTTTDWTVHNYRKNIDMLDKITKQAYLIQVAIHN